jgi:hypothetical protein
MNFSSESGGRFRDCWRFDMPVVALSAPGIATIKMTEE